MAPPLHTLFGNTALPDRLRACMRPARQNMDRHAPPKAPSSTCSSIDQEWELVPANNSPPKNKLDQPAISPVSVRPATPQPIMPGWKDDYLTSLLDAERNNPVNLDLVEACKC